VSATSSIAGIDSARRAAGAVGTRVLTVIVPCYNEGATVERLVERVSESPLAGQIIAVDDGSTDDTYERLLAMRARVGDRLTVFRHAKNRGKGAAIRTALEHAECEFTIIQDADLEYDPADYDALLEPLRDGRASVVYGNRWHPANKHSSGRYFLGGVLLTVIANVLYGLRIHDEATCYKTFRTDVLRRIQLGCKGFEFCPEVTAKVARLGYEIHEVPIRYTPRSFKEGKKIRWHDGLQAIWVLLRLRFARSTRFQRS
jgi:dolichol-phosphate mannosyltransferase